MVVRRPQRRDAHRRTHRITARMTTIRLVTRADDLGSFSGAAAAAVDAHRHGIIQNAGLMVPTPWFADAAARVKEAPELCLGLHMTICCEWGQNRWRPLLPARQVPSLVGADGYFHADPVAMHHAGIKPDEILAECQAQLDRARAHGLDIIYADTHMCWEWMHPLPHGERLSEILPAWCQANGVLWTARLPAAMLPHPGATAHTLQGRLLAQLNVTRPGTYLYVIHPSLHGTGIGQELPGHGAGAIAAERVADWRLGRSAVLKAELARRGVTTVRWDALVAA